MSGPPGTAAGGLSSTADCAAGSEPVRSLSPRDCAASTPSVPCNRWSGALPLSTPRATRCAVSAFAAAASARRASRPSPGRVSCPSLALVLTAWNRCSACSLSPASNRSTAASNCASSAANWASARCFSVHSSTRDSSSVSTSSQPSAVWSAPDTASITTVCKRETHSPTITSVTRISSSTAIVCSVAPARWTTPCWTATTPRSMPKTR